LSTASLLGVTLIAAAVRAQVSDPARIERARDAVKRGLQAMGEHDPSTALAEYRLAETLVPEANLPHRYEGDALAALGQWQEAVKEYERYLERKPDVHDASDTRALIDRLRAEHLEGLVSIECTPSGGDVFLDGAATPIGTTPLRGMRASAGDHTLVVSLSGYETTTYPIRVAPGATTAIPCSLTAKSASRNGRARAGALVAIGGVLVLAGSVTVDLAVLGPAVADFHRSAAAGDGQAHSLENKVDVLKGVVVASYATGAVLTASGLALLLWSRRTSSASVALQPMGVSVDISW
jgi:hypothetical protein